MVEPMIELTTESSLSLLVTLAGNPLETMPPSKPINLTLW